MVSAREGVPAASLSDTRIRAVFHNLLSTAVARAVTVASGFALVPWLLAELGARRYGEWVALLSVLTFIPSLDLGIGMSLLSRLARAEGRGDVREQRDLLATAYSILWLISLSLLVIMLVLHGMGLEQLSAELQACAVLVGTAVCITLPVSIGPRIQLALGRGVSAGRWSLVGAIATLLASITGVLLHTGVTGLCAAWLFGWAVSSAGAFVGIPGDRRPPLIPGPLASMRSALVLSTDMTWLSLLQLSSWLVAAGDPLLVALYQGEKSAASYALTQQLLGLPGQVVALAVQPLWAAFAHAWTSGDYDWARSTLARALSMAGMFALLGSGALSLFSPVISSLWADDNLSSDRTLLTGMVMATVVTSLGATASSFLNGLGALRAQAFLAVPLITLGLIGKGLCLKRGDLAFVPWVTFTSYAACVLGPYSFMIAARLRKR